MMPVCAPASRVQVNFDIAPDGFGRIELDNCISEVRAGFTISEPGMKHFDGLSVQSFELVTHDALVLPNDLQELFRRQFIRAVVQCCRRAGMPPPLDIQAGRGSWHVAIAFAPAVGQSQVTRFVNRRVLQRQLLRQLNGLNGGDRVSVGFL